MVRAPATAHCRAETGPKALARQLSKTGSFQLSETLCLKAVGLKAIEERHPMPYPGPCGGLNEKCPPWARIFGHLVPGWWRSLLQGRGLHQGRGLTGERPLQEAGIESLYSCRTSCLLSVLSEVKRSSLRFSAPVAVPSSPL